MTVFKNILALAPWQCSGLRADHAAAAAGNGGCRQDT
jgi:hypothetical protein